MPDHIHLLLWTLESLLPKLMRDWKSASGFAIAKARAKHGAIWQERYLDFILRRARDFGNKVEYIHANPVEAKLVALPEEWAWSSAAFYIKKAPAQRFQPDVFTGPTDPNGPAKARAKHGAIWQERYFDFILRRVRDFGNKLEYIHANPVEANLVARPEDWAWSSAAFYTKKAPVRIQPDLFTGPTDPNEPLWPVQWR